MTDWYSIADIFIKTSASPSAHLFQQTFADEIGSNAGLVAGAVLLVLIVLAGILGYSRRKR